MSIGTGLTKDGEQKILHRWVPEKTMDMVVCLEDKRPKWASQSI
jgi:hypothetical protein